MKRCPECRRDYYDETLSFCLEDGVELVHGLVSIPDEPSTAILHETAPPAEAATRAQIHTTEQTALMPSGISDIPKSAIDKRLIAAPLLIVIIVAGAYFGYQYLGTNTGQINSIAVMPFQNNSMSPETEYLSNGLTESLIYRLSQIQTLKVSPSSSVFRYKGKETDPVKAASELGVAAVMTGRIVQRGDDLTISVELVDVSNSKTLWGEKYDRKMSELLATQQEITTEIVQKLRLKLAGDDQKQLEKTYTVNNEAYQLYLKGRFHYAKRTRADMEKAITYFEQALAIDPNFALAYVGITNTYSVMPAYGYAAPKEVGPKMKSAAQKALEIDPNLAEAHAAVGSVAVDFWDWKKAESEFKKAIELDPNVAEIHKSYGNYFSVMGRPKEAIAELKRALELEPLSVAYGSILASFYSEDGQLDKALEQIKAADNLEPGHPIAVYYLGLIYNKMGMHDKAIAGAEKVLEKDPFNQDSLVNAGYAYAKSGHRRKAEEMIERLREISKRQYVLASYFSQIYGALGEKDKAFAELEKANTERDANIPLMNAAPYFDDIRDDPRFAAIAKRAGLPDRK